MSDSDESTRGRIPIYFDVERVIADAVDAASNEYDPGNSAAVKLCSCNEAAKDLCEALESALSSDADKFRRRLKSVFTPLHSLAERTVDLMNEIESNPGKTGSGGAMAKMREDFVAAVPFSRTGKLGRLRNKISAHHEKNWSPGEMRQLFSEVENTEIGEWIHSTLAALLTLLKIPVYMWGVASRTPGVIHIMFCEPMIASIGVAEDGQIKAHYGTTMCKESPRWQIADVLIRAAEISMNLFERSSERKIIGVSTPQRKAFFDPSLEFVIGSDKMP